MRGHSALVLIFWRMRSRPPYGLIGLVLDSLLAGLLASVAGLLAPA